MERIDTLLLKYCQKGLDGSVLINGSDFCQKNNLQFLGIGKVRWKKSMIQMLSWSL